MKKIRYIALLVLLLAGCKDYLDIVPKGKMIPKTTDDYRLLLDFTTYNNVGELFTITRTYGIACLLEPAYQKTTQTQFEALMPTQPLYHKYCWAQSGTLWQSNSEEDPDWRSLYQKIYLANLVLDGLSSATGTRQAKEQLEGECYVHRAFSYFALVNIYAKAYDPATADTEPGVPIRATTLLNERLERKTVGDVYRYMEADLLNAIQLQGFANTQEFNHRPTKTAAYAMLARVYLFMGRYADALNAANEALARKNDIYDFNSDMVLTTADPRYNATEWPQYGLKKAYPTGDREAILWKEPAAVTAQYSAGYSVYTSNHDYVANLFDISSDLRFNHYFTGTEAAGYTFNPITRRYLTVYYHFIGLGVPEMILTRIECMIREGQWQTAVAELEAFRRLRIRSDNYAPLEGLTGQAGVLAAIKKERERELIFKGINFFDIKRYNVQDNAEISLKRSYFKDGEWITGFSLTPGSLNWQMPLPPLYVAMNPEMKQNPGYFEE